MTGCVDVVAAVARFVMGCALMISGLCREPRDLTMVGVGMLLTSSWKFEKGRTP